MPLQNYKKLRVGQIEDSEVVIVPPPPANRVHYSDAIIFHNADSSARTLQLKLYYDGTAYQIAEVILQAGDTRTLGKGVTIALDGDFRYIVAVLTTAPGTPTSFVATYGEQAQLNPTQEQLGLNNA